VREEGGGADWAGKGGRRGRARGSRAGAGRTGRKGKRAGWGFGPKGVFPFFLFAKDSNKFN